MNQSNKQVTSEIEVAAEAGADSRPVALPSRRRLIKLGASAVPVLATLTSQSALAGVCISTSAWGSDQISNSASQAARHANQSVPVTTGYTIATWNTPDSTNAAWTAFKVNYPGFTNVVIDGVLSFDLSQLTFDKLYEAVGGTYMRSPSSLGFNSTSFVTGNLTSDDKGYFMVAMLNYVVNAKPPIECVTEVNWLSIVAGTYPAGTAWDVHQIRRYLELNYIVQP